ncbi:MAG: NAD(P)/FAD-dependent oxidoreductase [Rhodoplanes sp.]|jgi:menaquinone-9 beta-reductase
MARIAIVGAGPGGSTAALALARSGKHDVVLLDRDAWPRMKTCGSALSPRCLALIKKLGVAGRLRPRAYGIRGLRFTGPAGRTAVLTGKEGAWVIARAEFDAELAFLAERHGARFIQQFKATKLLRDGAGRVCGVTDGKRAIECDIVLTADGAHSRFSPDPRPKRRIATIMSWYEGIPFTEGHMEMWFDKRVTPWYGWLFPESAKRVNIGICYGPDDPANPLEIFREIVARHVGELRMRNAEQVIKFRGAPIVYTERVGPVHEPGALWIGEAARLTNALTGEGIGHAMQSALLAADCIERYPAHVLGAHYERALKWAFTPRLKSALAAMRFVGTPAFSAVSTFVSVRPVEKAIAYALAHL